MGRCSYCFEHRSWDWGGECFSWDEARGCFKIAGPDDPKYLAAKRAYEVYRAKDDIIKARELRMEGRKTTAQARQLEANAKAVLKGPRP